ncbi:MAG: hypothetical protein ACTSYA_01450 [Candidatus Kariarchaeaceae archaeon]
MNSDKTTISDMINEEFANVKEKCLTFFTSQWQLCFSEPFSQEIVDIINSLSVKNQALTDPYYYSFLDYQNNKILIDNNAINELIITKIYKNTEDVITTGREIHVAIQLIKRVIIELLPQSSKLDKKITELLSCFMAYDVLELDVLKKSRSWNFWEYLDSNKIESKNQTNQRHQPLIFYTYAYLMHRDITKIARLSTRLLHWVYINQPFSETKYSLFVNQIYEQSQGTEEYRSTYWLYSDLRNLLSDIIQSPEIINSFKRFKEFNSSSLASELTEQSLKSSLKKLRVLHNPIYLNYINYGLLDLNQILLKVEVPKENIKSLISLIRNPTNLPIPVYGGYGVPSSENDNEISEKEIYTFYFHIISNNNNKSLLKVKKFLDSITKSEKIDKKRKIRSNENVLINKYSIETLLYGFSNLQLEHISDNGLTQWPTFAHLKISLEKTTMKVTKTRKDGITEEIVLRDDLDLTQYYPHHRMFMFKKNAWEKSVNLSDHQFKYLTEVKSSSLGSNYIQKMDGFNLTTTQYINIESQLVKKKVIQPTLRIFVRSPPASTLISCSISSSKQKVAFLNLLRFFPIVHITFTENSIFSLILAPDPRLKSKVISNEELKNLIETYVFFGKSPNDLTLTDEFAYETVNLSSEVILEKGKIICPHPFIE